MAGGTDVAVADGGTGASTLAAHGVLIGNGTSAVAVTGAGTTGQVLTSNGASADPTFQSVAGTGDVVGPASATADHIAVFDGTTGKLLKDSGVLAISSVTSSAGAGDAGKLAVLNGSGQFDPSFLASSGTGSFVRVTSATMVTPILGTPTSGTLTNCTGLPASGLAAGVLGANITFGENTSLVLETGMRW